MGRQLGWGLCGARGGRLQAISNGGGGVGESIPADNTPDAYGMARCLRGKSATARSAETTLPGGVSPYFVRVPAAVGRGRIIACDEVLLENGRLMRLSVFRCGEGDKSLLSIELSDGSGGIEKSGFFDQSILMVAHEPGDDDMIHHRLETAGLGEGSVSSIYDESVLVPVPHDPLHIFEFMEVVQSKIGSIGRPGLVPAWDEWAVFSPSHDDQLVPLRENHDY